MALIRGRRGAEERGRKFSSLGDIPPLDVHFLEMPNTDLNEYGARGVGEIGLAGIAAAIANAVHHATGIRVRNLPIRIEDLLEPAEA